MEQIIEDTEKKTEQILVEAVDKLEIIADEAVEAVAEHAVETIKQGCWCLWNTKKT